MPSKLFFKKFSNVDQMELELPETTYIRDIENKVLQGIVVHCLSDIDGISLVHGNFINNILGKDNLEGIRGIQTQQDNKHQCLTVKVEINIEYGIPIPEKAEEVQNKITKEITRLTGLHVSSIHVVFKNVTSKETIRNDASLENATSNQSGN